MKLAMAQMAMSTDMAENLKNSLRFCEEAKGSDLLFFPEIQLCPFSRSMRRKTWTPIVCARTRRRYVRFPPRRERAAIICRRTCILK